MRHPLCSVVFALLLVLPAAPGTVRSRAETLAMQRAYTEAERRCTRTGLTLLLFDGGSRSSGGDTSVSRARASAEAVRFERGLRRRGEAGGGGRLLPRSGGLVANLSNASLELALRSLSVVSAEPDCMVYLPSHEAPVRVERRGEARRRRLGVQSAPPSWGLDRIDDRTLPLDSTYDYGGYTGAGVRVYVLDTGVRTSHEEFGGRTDTGYTPACPTGGEAACGSNWFVNGVVDASCHPHGTHCAGTVAGASAGVAKEATIVPVMVLGCDGSGSTGYVIAGVEWAIADLAAHPGTRGVISMSLGGGGYSPAYDAAIRAAHDAGIPAVAAAGNDGIDQCDASPLTEPKSIVV